MASEADMFGDADEPVVGGDPGYAQLLEGARPQPAPPSADAPPTPTPTPAPAPAVAAAPAHPAPAEEDGDGGQDPSNAPPAPAEWPSLAGSGTAPAAVWPKERTVLLPPLQPVPTPKPKLQPAPSQTGQQTEPGTVTPEADGGGSAFFPAEEALAGTATTTGPTGAETAEASGGPGSVASGDSPFPAREFVRSSDVLIVDTAGFIKNAPLERMATRVVTIRDVVAEIRDKTTRERLAVQAYDLEFREPSSAALHFVTEFSKLTGDFKGLSAVDLRVLALAYMLEVEANGSDHISKKPRPPMHRTPGCFAKPCRFGAACTRKDCWFQHPPKSEIKAEAARRAAEPIVDDGRGWITPGNYKKVAESLSRQQAVKETVSVGCLTTDFAMQNVLLQMGLNVISVDGMLVKRVKTFVLKCSSCNTVCQNTQADFCPKCGNASLFKVSFTVDKWGNVHYTQRYTKTNTRGTKYSIPLPKGGRHQNIVLCEDQPERMRRRPKERGYDAFSDDFHGNVSPFAKVHKVNAKGGHFVTNKTKVGHGRRNPNSRI